MRGRREGEKVGGGAVLRQEVPSLVITLEWDQRRGNSSAML